MTFLRSADLLPPVEFMRMNKSGDQSGVGNSFNRVTGMVPAAGTNPDHIISNAIVVPYTYRTYDAIVSGQITWSGGIGPKVQCRIRRNGSDLTTGSTQTNSANAATASFHVNVEPGDSFELYWRGEGSFFTYPTCLGGHTTHLILAPQ